MTVMKSLLGLAAALAIVFLVQAADDKADKKADKSVTLKGELGCPKCVFGIAKKCANAIKVKEGDKELIYTFIDAEAKAPYHAQICTEGKPGSVTGVVSKKDDKLFIKPAKDGVKFD
ncbi:MAG: DUF6370 family protein [Gemmataceae bacterium]